MNGRTLLDEDPKVISLSEWKREEETTEDLSLADYSEAEAELELLVATTLDNIVVFVTHPNEQKGIALSPEQARQVGTALIERAAIAELDIRSLIEKYDEEEYDEEIDEEE